MANRIFFWKPKPRVDLWLPPDRPLGGAIADAVGNGEIFDLLQPFDGRGFLVRLHAIFTGSSIDKEGYLNWSDDLERGFVASAGTQHLEVCEFDLADEDMDRIVTVAEELEA